MHSIEVSEDVYDVLQRTAEHRGTDIAEAVKYLLEVPVPASSSTDDGDDE
jgi:hypothetical protein